MNRVRKSCGVTLIELMVCLGVIGLLVALLLPTVNLARSTARTMACQNNLRQVGLAMHNYQSSFRRLPPNVTTPWTIAVLPELEQRDLFDRYDHRFDPWGIRPANAMLGSTRIAVYECPDDVPNPSGPWNWASTSYAANIDFVGLRSVSLDQCHDGLSSTGLAIEIGMHSQFAIISGPVTPLGIGDSNHRELFHLLLGDGSVRSVSKSADINVLIAAGTPNGGEIISEF